MGKRKTKRKPMAKKKESLDVQFNCMFCNHERSVEVKMDKEHKVGNLKCRICGVQFQANINQLSDPVDVYSEWVDAVESVQEERNRNRLANARNKGPRGSSGIDLEDDDSQLEFEDDHHSRVDADISTSGFQKRPSAYEDEDEDDYE
ncbi:hypothetical protein G9A89_010331 [Geosiphon pyriformis]|nr:hypothetical protein G9A89_010331 [Geosiphon pyriformis]